MITHIYHCSSATLRDYRTSGGQNRPSGTGKWPSRAGEVDVDFPPPTDGFANPDLGRLLELFKHVDLDKPDSASPVWINWEYLQNALSLGREEINALMHSARELGLLRTMSLDVDHERWLRHSRIKGCLVVMTCVEESDLRRDRVEIAAGFCSVINDLVKSPAPRGLLGDGDELRAVFVVPNGHLAPRAGPGLDWRRAMDVLQALPPALEEQGYRAQLGSYGYEKLITLAINAHKRGYTLCVV